MDLIMKRISDELFAQNKKQSDLAEFIGVTANVITDWKSGRIKSYTKYIYGIAQFLNVSVEYLRGETDIKRPSNSYGYAPSVTSDFTTFPVIGEVAAGYDHKAYEDWTGDTIDIPNTYLKGHQKNEFFVLRVKGDSMYPMYQDGDKVLVLKQSSMDHSGQVGVVIYDGDVGTLKKIEYNQGEDWMRLVPINPAFPPIKIKDSALEQCKVLGIPKLLIREIEQ